MRDKNLHIGRQGLDPAQSGTGVSHSTTLRVEGACPMCRQVMECARNSAAFPLAPAGLSSNQTPTFRFSLAGRPAHELSGNLLSPALSSTSLWRRGEKARGGSWAQGALSDRGTLCPPRRALRARRGGQRVPRSDNAPCAHEPPRASSPSPPQTCGGEGRGEEVPTQFMSRTARQRKAKGRCLVARQTSGCERESGAVARALHDLSAHRACALNAKRRGVRNASSALGWIQALSADVKIFVSHPGSQFWPFFVESRPGPGSSLRLP